VIDRVEALLLGTSPQIREVRRLVVRFGPLQLPVVVTGPTGAGKGVVAQALHESSQRPGRFVAANVAALGDSLVESELFGHVRGAFTGSAGSRRGLARHADRGTLFLDEIHRLSPVAQPKLLRALDTQLIRPVGSDDEIRADFRVISAANEDLGDLVDAGRFQGDLLARLSRLVIHVPPLVDHIEDVPLLAERFVQSLEMFGGSRFTQTGFDALMEYDWPRNVRELCTVVERAAILADRPRIDRSDVVAALHVGARRRHLRLAASPTEQRERRLFDALDATDGRVRDAATHLGVSLNTVYRWMTEFGVPTPERRRRPRSVATLI
jgi:DNA-binding NtrC family response regulator